MRSKPCQRANVRLIIGENKQVSDFDSVTSRTGLFAWDILEFVGSTDSRDPAEQNQTLANLPKLGLLGRLRSYH
jgi:hypothetical protein